MIKSRLLISNMANLKIPIKTFSVQSLKVFLLHKSLND